MYLRSLAAAVVVFASTLVAHADTETFDYTLTPTNGIYSGYGTVTLDYTAGQSTYNLSDGLISITGFFDTIADSDAYSQTYGLPESVTMSDGEITGINVILLPTGSWSAADGYYFGSLSLDGASFESEGQLGSDHYLDESGTISDPPVIAATPEPSSLILLGTALVGATGIVRRRLSR